MTLRAALLLVAGLALVTAPPGLGRGVRSIDDVVVGLKHNPVYVDGIAELSISRADASRLRQRIETSGAGPVYIAILSSDLEGQAGGSPDGVLQAIHDGVGRLGTYAVVVGRHFRAGSQGVLRPGVAGDLATEALDAHRGEGVTPVLLDFVDRVADARRSGGGNPGDGDGDGGPGGGGGALIGLLVLGGGGFLVYRALARRRREQQELAEVKAAAHDDLIALADDVQQLEDPAEANPAAKREYDLALASYDTATRSYDRARRAAELEAVAGALEEGRYHMAAARAQLEGRPVPERRPPCFFDPRHGPSSRDVEWAPPGGTSRQVPACEADAQAVERGVEPASREVTANGRRVPYWAAPSYFSPWAGGYFMPFGGMGFLSGLFVGELLGGGFGGFGYGAVGGGGGFGSWDDGGGDGGGWSDFGGGMDFGGGDFGGGGDF